MRTPCRATNMFDGSGENNKKMIGQMSGKITAILRNDQNFGPNFLKGGLKSITTKQFVSILAFFMKNLSGNRFTIGTNPPDDIMKFLTTINYPYMITKSSLKTPNSPHAFPAIVHILSWLCDFLDAGDPVEQFEHCDYVVVDPQFPDAEYTKLFWDNIKDNFCYWNNEQDSKVEMCRDWLIDECIRKRIGIISLKDLEAEISSQRKVYNDLLRERFSVKKESLLSETRTKLQRLNQELVDLQTANERLQLEVKLLRDDDSEKSAVLEGHHEKIAQLKSIIGAQKWSVQDFHRFAEELCIKRQHCMNERAAVQQMTDTVRFPAEVEVARLQKQLVDIVSKHNAHVGQVYAAVKRFNLFDIDVAALTVAPNTAKPEDFDKQIEAICKWLQQIEKKVDETKVSKLQAIEQLVAKLDVAKYEADLHAEEKEKIGKKLADIQSKIQSIEVAILNGKHLKRTVIAECHRRCEVKQSEIDELCRTIQDKRKKAEVINEENDHICARVKAKADEMLSAQKKDLEECRVILADFRLSMEEVEQKLDVIEAEIKSNDNYT